MLQIGLQITNNYKKYLKLLDLLNENYNFNNKVDFIHIPKQNEIIKYIENLDVLHCYQIDKTYFDKATTKLKWIQIGAAGVEKSLIKEVIKSKTIITNVSGIHAEPVSEYVLSTILYFNKLFNDIILFKKNKQWTQWDIASRIDQLKNKTMGIIGYGKIGIEISKKAKAFKMKVIATKRLQKRTETKRFVDKLIPISDLSILLKESDFVVICCPLTPLTKNMITLDQLKLMKKTSILINIARGDIINEKDLIHALKTQCIGGAALDVFTNEPLSNKSELFKLENAFISPHISGNYKNYQKDMIQFFGENLNRFIMGKTLKNRICKKRLY